jgi:hypothetical protein
VRPHALCVSVHLAETHIGHRREYFGARRQVGRVRYAAGMHQLHGDLAALGVDGIGNGLPSTGLRIIEQPGIRG